MRALLTLFTLFTVWTMLEDLKHICYLVVPNTPTHTHYKLWIHFKHFHFWCHLWPLPYLNIFKIFRCLWIYHDIVDGIPQDRLMSVNIDLFSLIYILSWHLELMYTFSSQLWYPRGKISVFIVLTQFFYQFCPLVIRNI